MARNDLDPGDLVRYDDNSGEVTASDDRGNVTVSWDHGGTTTVRRSDLVTEREYREQD